MPKLVSDQSNKGYRENPSFYYQIMLNVLGEETHKKVHLAFGFGLQHHHPDTVHTDLAGLGSEIQRERDRLELAKIDIIRCLKSKEKQKNL